MMYISAIFVAVLVVSMTPASVVSDSNVNDELVELLLRLQSTLDKQDKDGAAANVKPVYQTRHDDVKVVLQRGMAMKGRKMKASVRSGPGLTVTQQNDLVNAINRARKNEGATDMYMIRWNSSVASLAQEWSDQCEFTHGFPLFDGLELGFDELGQNNWLSSGPFSAVDVVKDWMSEKPGYNLATNKCTGKSCDRYKQLVWSYSTDVGCGFTTCNNIADIVGNGNFLVCYFGPESMYADEKPYTPGAAPCTQCSLGQFYCNDGLCDAKCTESGPNCECKADCKNCGTATSTCSCQCKPGAVGVNCAKLCDNFDPQCGKPTGWPKYFCDYEDFTWVHEQCPLMCQRCEKVDPCAAAGK